MRRPLQYVHAVIPLRSFRTRSLILIVYFCLHSRHFHHTMQGSESSTLPGLTPSKVFSAADHSPRSWGYLTDSVLKPGRARVLLQNGQASSPASRSRIAALYSELHFGHIHSTYCRDAFQYSCGVRSLFWDHSFANEGCVVARSFSPALNLCPLQNGQTWSPTKRFAME